MFCLQCGAKIDSNSKYCSSCGAKLPIMETDKNSTHLTNSPNQQMNQTVQKRRMPLWFKILTTLAILALIAVTAGILFTESLVDVIDHQLDALHNKNISEAYYRYTSKDFQKTTSLEQFEEFIQAYPIFQNSQSAHFIQRSIDHHIGTLKGNLTSIDHQNIPVEYKLIKEDGKWKILSIRLLQPEASKSKDESIHSQDLIDTVQAQLKTLQIGNIEEVYNQYSSQEFKEATSLQDFENFLKKYPILINHTTVSFQKPVTKNGMSIIAAIVKSVDSAAYLKYYLVRENNTWKIWSMRILSPSEEAINEEKPISSHPEMAFLHIKLGNQIDENGIVTKPTTKFKTDSGHIYANVEIANGIKDNIIYLNFQHLDSGSFIPTKATIEENGDTILMSIFSPPIGGWPKGHYKLVITSPKGLNKVVDFDIE